MKQGPCSHIYKLERTLLTSKNNTCQALSIAQDEPSKNGSGSSNPTLKCSESGDAGDHHSGGIPGTLVGWGDDLVTDRGAWLLSNPHMQWDKQSLPTWALFTSRECLKQVCVSSVPQRDSLHGNNIRGVFLSFPEAKQKELHPLQFYETDARTGNEGSERLSNFPAVTELGGKAEIPEPMSDCLITQLSGREDKFSGETLVQIQPPCKQELISLEIRVMKMSSQRAVQ